MRAPSFFTENAGLVAAAPAMGRSYLESTGNQLPRVIYPEVRVITADRITLNKTLYPEASLRGNPDEGTGLISFTSPYPVPIIKDHNTGGGMFGGEASEVYGRIERPAQFMKIAGEGFVRAMPTITHPFAIESILSGRWLTVSQGARTEMVRCSVCRAELTDDENDCEHVRGMLYEGMECYWEIGPIKAKEVSFVVTPSDVQAGVLTPNLAESAGHAGASEAAAPVQAFGRILVENSHGLFDLRTGKAVNESFHLRRRPLPGIHALGFAAPNGVASPRQEAHDGPPAGGPATIRKGNMMAKKTHEQSAAPTHAAKLISAEHQVEVALYPLPTCAEGLADVLAQIEAMPHGPTEKAEILSRIAAASRRFLDASEWQSQFGELPACEEGEPVAIALSGENYGLLFSWMEHCQTPAEAAVPAPAAAEAETPAAPPVADGEPAGDSGAVTETETPAEAETVETKVEAPAEAETAETPVETPVVEATPESRLSLRLAELERMAKEAQAHAIAFYMRAMRKPQTRGKAHEQLVAELSGRTLESLRDRMNDLAEEWAAAGHPVEGSHAPAAALPTLTDPTVAEAPTGRLDVPEKVAAGDEAVADAAETATPEPSAAPELSATELPLEEGEDEIIAVDPSWLAELFPSLKA